MRQKVADEASMPLDAVEATATAGGVQSSEFITATAGSVTIAFTLNMQSEAAADTALTAITAKLADTTTAGTFLSTTANPVTVEAIMAPTKLVLVSPPPSPPPPSAPPSPPSLPEACPTCWNGYSCDDLVVQSAGYPGFEQTCATLESGQMNCNCFGCLCNMSLLMQPLPPSPPLPPLPPLPPPASPTAIGDPKFGCGYRGLHLAEPMTPDALTAAVNNADVTCIKLAPITYSLTSTLLVGQDGYSSTSINGVPVPQHPRGSAPLAILAEEGPATLDGGGSVQLISSKSGADVSLANLVLRNGYADWDVRLCHPACVSCRFHGLRTAC